MWSDTMGVSSADGRITLKAAENVSRNLSPTEAYEQSIYVNKAVRVIASQISQANVRQFTKDGEEIEDSPELRLLKKPAPKTSGRRLIFEIVAWLNTYGEYAVKVEQSRGEVMPTALYVLSPRTYRCINRRRSPRPSATW